MSKEAMKLALEALETERENYQDWDKQDGAPEYIYEAITALREALVEPDFWEGYVPEPVKPAQQALDKKAENARELGLDYEPAQQEPVAWYDSKTGWTDFHSFKPTRKPSAPDAEWLPLYTTSPQPGEKNQEPVLWMMPDGKTVNKWGLQFYSNVVGTPLYTSPPARQEPLSEEWIAYCWRKSMIGTRIHYVDYLALVREIERAHGIKGGK